MNDFFNILFESMNDELTWMSFGKLKGREHCYHFFPVCEKSLETGSARFRRKEVTQLGTDICAVSWCVGFFLNP